MRNKNFSSFTYRGECIMMEKHLSGVTSALVCIDGEYQTLKSYDGFTGLKQFIIAKKREKSRIFVNQDR